VRRAVKVKESAGAEIDVFETTLTPENPHLRVSASLGVPLNGSAHVQGASEPAAGQSGRAAAAPSTIPILTDQYYEMCCPSVKQAGFG